MRRVDEKYYDKLTCVIGDYKNIKQKNVRFPKNAEGASNSLNKSLNHTNNNN